MRGETTREERTHDASEGHIEGEKGGRASGGFFFFFLSFFLSFFFWGGGVLFGLHLVLETISIGEERDV